MAASACLNVNSIGFSPDNFFISMSNQQDKLSSDLPDPDDDLPVADFEFRSSEDPVIMLPADQLFSDGKLIPLHQPTTTTTTPSISKPRRRVSVSVADPFSKATPSRWKQLLSFRKNNNISKSDENSNNANANGATKSSIKQFLQRGGSKLSPNENLPLLKDTDNETTSSSRLSLSSSSSGHDPEELPRVSIDSSSEKAPVAVEKKVQNGNFNPPRMRMVKIRRAAAVSSGEGSVRIESPRMNSSGKIVFERSSSLNLKQQQRGGMERSYSGNVRVLNVPVCSVRKSGGVFGLPLFSSPTQNQKRTEGGGGGGGSRKSKTSLG